MFNHYLKTILILLLSLCFGTASAAEMFRDLSYGDTKQEVYKKLGDNKTPVKAKVTLFGTTVTSTPPIPIDIKVQDLTFSAYLIWDESNDEDRLHKVDLISDGGNRAQLNKAYKELAILLTELYGYPKFNNGLPSESKLQNADSTVAGAVWFYDGNAATLGICRAENSIAIIIQFMEKQPDLIKIK
ncbi:hypothetical protein OAB00_02865 [Akkermansiaceae bacterium]|nr:hypothetical protein [Akkermansiaceae bacterium]